MKNLVISIIIFMLSTQYLHAQNNTIAGQYSLSGVMETASGIQLNDDSTFLFYFSYGALDREGSGKWSMHGDNIVLDSKPYAGKDFKMVKNSFVTANGIIIKIEDANTNLYRLVYCLVKRPVGDTIINADENGIMAVPYDIDSIHLLCELCTERMTSFPIDPQKNNSFTFHFEPWITEVFFKSFPLRYIGDHLVGKHPLLDDKEYSFKREK